MDDIAAFFHRLAGVYRGRGVNHEHQEYDGVLEIEPPLNPQAVVTRFVAAGLDGQVMHREVMMIVKETGGVWQALAVNSNMPGCQRFEVALERSGTLHLVHGDAADRTSFREVMTLAPQGPDVLSHSFHWAFPGDDLKLQSQAILSRT